MTKKKTAVIIGSGVGGMALSVRLARAGFDVTVIEKNTFPGGKLSEVSLNGYRFDAGPSLFTMPHLVDELFSLCGENPTDHFTYTRLDTICRYFFSSGKQVDSFADAETFAQSLENGLGEPRENVIRYLRESKRKWDVTADLFVFSDFSNPKTFLSIPFIKGLSGLKDLHVFQTMNEYNNSRLETPEAIQLFNRYATYNGCDPFRVPATLSVIPHVEYGIGAFIPDKGIIDITNAIFKLAVRQGVNFRMGEKALEIIHKNGRVTGVKTDRTTYATPIVISNADVVPTYKYLLNDESGFNKTARLERSTSALVFNWGMKRKFPELEIHNIFFSADYQAEFKALFGTKILYTDPTIYLFISSKHVPGDAPEGGENWFTMINVPENVGQDWDDIIRRGREVLIKKISAKLGFDISEFIEAEIVEDPRWIEARTSSWHGSLYGASGNSKFSAFLRHSNRSNKYEGLYFTGGSVHPGAGIPMCMASAKITAEIIENKYNK
jgi:diapolycopene oxygenase